MESVTFHCGGRRIFGNLHLPYKGAPCIIALHGLESDKDSSKWPIIASKLCRESYAFLRFNFRGCGNGLEKSEGLFEETCLTSRIEDYRAAIKFLWDSSEVDVNRLGVIGSSFGGMVALAAQNKRIKAMVVMATPYKIPVLGESRLSRELGIYELPSGRRLKDKFFKDLEKYDLLKAVKKAPPILIIHGSMDEIVPVEHALKIYEAAPEPKRLEIIDGGDHTFSRVEHLDRAINLSLEWFNKYL
ncbi:MAG: YqiA/YcfP family alpha/beta fold hydrolase [Candidatus Bathyarchaeia archaeon]